MGQVSRPTQAAHGPQYVYSSSPYTCINVRIVWNNIRPKLEEQLATEKERRAQEAYEDRVSDRLDILVHWYDDYLMEHFTDAERGLMPNRYNARELPSLLSLAQVDDTKGIVSREAFVALTEQMLADADAYKARAKRDLADVLCRHSACQDLKDLPADDVLHCYCSYFTCRWRCWANSAVDGCSYLTYEQLHAHWREAHPGDPWLMDGDEDHRYIVVDVPRIWQDSVPGIARRVLEAVGIPLDTPREVLDRWVEEGRLFCACEHPEMPLPGDISWAKLVSTHVMALMVRRNITYSPACAFGPQLFHLLHQVHNQGEREGEMCVNSAFVSDMTSPPEPPLCNVQETPRRQTQPKLRPARRALAHRRR